MKSVIITGASRGIGAACAKLFAEMGWQVLVNYNKSEKEALSLCQEINASGGKAVAYQADVSDKSAVSRLFSKAIFEFGKIDCLVNNAGIALKKPFLFTEDGEWDEIFNTNVKSVYYCTKEAVKYMQENGGKIINISSIWGICGGANEVAYSAAKSAIIGMTKALAKELAPKISVNCIAPGVVDTDMNGDLTDDEKSALEALIPMQKMATPMEIAKTVAFLASTDNYLTGQIISPNGGFYI